MTDSSKPGNGLNRIDGIEDLHRIAGKDISRYDELLKVLVLQRDIAIELGKMQSLAESLDLVTRMCLGLPGTDAAGIYILDQKTLHLILASHKGFSEEFIQSARSYDSTTIQYMIVMEGNSNYMDLTDPTYTGKKMLLKEGLKCFGMIPVRSNGNIIGVLNLCSHASNSIPEISRMAAETIASQVGSVLLRIRSEEETRRNLTNLKAMFDSLSDILLIMDTKGIIIEVNSEATRTLGYDQDGLIGMNFLDLLKEEQRGVAATMLEKLACGETVSLTVPFSRSDGSDIQMNAIVGCGLWNEMDVRYAMIRKA